MPFNLNSMFLPQLLNSAWQAPLQSKVIIALARLNNFSFDVKQFFIHIFLLHLSPFTIHRVRFDHEQFNNEEYPIQIICRVPFLIISSNHTLGLNERSALEAHFILFCFSLTLFEFQLIDYEVAPTAQKCESTVHYDNSSHPINLN